MFGLGFQEIAILGFLVLGLVAIVFVFVTYGKLLNIIKRDRTLEAENRQLQLENERLKKGV